MATASHPDILGSTATAPGRWQVAIFFEAVAPVAFSGPDRLGVSKGLLLDILILVRQDLLLPSLPEIPTELLLLDPDMIRMLPSVLRPPLADGQ